MRNLKKLSILTLVVVFCVNCSSDDLVLNEKVNSIEKVSKDLSVNLKIDNSIKRENAIILNDIEAMKEFISSIKNQLKVLPIEEKNYHNRLGPCDKVSGLFTGRALTSGFADLNYSVSVRNGNVNDVNGFFSGMTLGAGYSNGGYSQSTSGGNVELTTTGTVNYNLFVEGIGTIYSQRVKYKIEIPCGGGREGKPTIYPLPLFD